MRHCDVWPCVTLWDLCGATQLISAGISNWQQDESQFLNSSKYFQMAANEANPPLVKCVKSSAANVRPMCGTVSGAVMLVVCPRLVTAWAGECRYRREPKLTRLQQVQQMWLFIAFCPDNLRNRIKAEHGEWNRLIVSIYKKATERKKWFQSD